MVALALNTSESSPWDVLETFPNLHSRAREVKTRICTEAPYSKSLDCVEIWQAIYDCRDGLESFTRDPIGYEGSPWDLYEYCGSFPLASTDSSGLITEVRTICTYRLLSYELDGDNPFGDCYADFEIERVCQTGKRDNENQPRERDGWHYQRPIQTSTSTFTITGQVNAEYCGSCAEIYLEKNGRPKNGNVPPVNTDTGWLPQPVINVT